MRNRSALWALLGVIVGFGLPIVTCVGLVLVAGVGMAMLVSQAEPADGTTVHVSGPLSGPAVVLIDVSGPIVSGHAPPFTTAPIAASGDLIPLIQRAAEDPDVKALVLRINSPGGGVVASDEIYHALRELDKPIVVSMGDVVASGAYYISMAASHIVANPNTLTGSIGVISQFPNAKELMEKLGIEMTVIKSGKVKDLGSPFRPMTEEEQAIWQAIVEETYDRFVAIVVEGRDLPEDQVRELADGRVYTGQQALELGLVDALGYEEDAIAEAARLGGIPGEPRVIRYRRQPSFFRWLGGQGWAQGLSIPGLPPDWFQRLLMPTLEYRWAP